MQGRYLSLHILQMTLDIYPCRRIIINAYILHMPASLPSFSAQSQPLILLGQASLSLLVTPMGQAMGCPGCLASPFRPQPPPTQPISSAAQHFDAEDPAQPARLSTPQPAVHSPPQCLAQPQSGSTWFLSCPLSRWHSVALHDGHDLAS
jgi:hypothetical protein